MIVGLLGSNGQLGTEIIKVHSEYEIPTSLRLFNRKNLDFYNFEDSEALRGCDFIINTVAYHKPVDDLEKNFDEAFRWNVNFPRKLAQFCSEHDIVLIHISTDYVYSGLHNVEHPEWSNLNPQNVYGLTKLWGEQAITHYCDNHFIFRVASIFGSKGNNFVENIVNIFKKNGEVTLPHDQYMSPISCDSIAKIIFYIINEDRHYGVYNLKNTGDPVSWYDFTKKIFELKGLDVSKIKKKNYIDNKTEAIRPQFAQMNTHKLHYIFPDIDIPSWEEALTNYIRR